MANTLQLGNGKWATGKDTLLGYNSENNNIKPLPFSFSRASSATVVNQSGLIETVGSGEPRIDFKDNTKGALLLEPQSSNITYPSENFSSQLQGASSTFGTVVSPYGTLNGSTIASTSDGAYKGWHQTYSLTDDTYTFSMFVKYYNSQWISIYRIGQSISRFDVKNGVFGNNPSNLKSVNYGNGWYRLEFTFTATSGTNWLYIYPSSDSGETSSIGDGLYIWGGQLEQSSYATSYIPTSGSAVTRVGDACNNENLNVDYSGDYTLYLEHETLSITEYNQFQFRQETSISYIFRVGNSINVGSGLYSATNTIGFNKFALSVGSDGSYSFYKNGSLLSSGSGLNANLETLKGDAAGMSIKDIKLYNTRLSNAELQALTTI